MLKGHLPSTLCWCRPRVETCEDCGGQMTLHRNVALLPDTQPRAYSPSGGPVCAV